MASELTAWLGDGDSRRTAKELDAEADVRRGTIRDAVGDCEADPCTEILLVDLDGEQNPLAHMAALLRVCRPQTAILATGSENSVALANDLYRGGVFLYLPKPLQVADLRRGLAEVSEAQEEGIRPEIQTSRLVLVHGKGMGVNTVTALLARLAAERGRYVLCVDLDPDFGTLALALDKAPQRGFAQALQQEANGSAERADVERMQTRVSDRLGLIAHPLDQAGQAGAEPGLVGVLDSFSAHAHMVLACGASVAQDRALRHLATNHVVVFEPTPAGVSIAARWLRILEGAASLLIVNHARPLPKLIGADQMRESLGDRAPDAELPYLRNMANAMAWGQPERALAKRERATLNALLNPLVGLAGVEEEAA